MTAVAAAGGADASVVATVAAAVAGEADNCSCICCNISLVVPNRGLMPRTDGRLLKP